MKPHRSEGRRGRVSAPPVPTMTDHCFFNDSIACLGPVVYYRAHGCARIKCALCACRSDDAVLADLRHALSARAMCSLVYHRRKPQVIPQSFPSVPGTLPLHNLKAGKPQDEKELMDCLVRVCLRSVLL